MINGKLLSIEVYFPGYRVVHLAPITKKETFQSQSNTENREDKEIPNVHNATSYRGAKSLIDDSPLCVYRYTIHSHIELQRNVMCRFFVCNVHLCASAFVSVCDTISFFASVFFLFRIRIILSVIPFITARLQIFNKSDENISKDLF